MELIAFSTKHLLHPHGHIVAVATDVEVKVVGKQGFKLRPVEMALCHHCAMLLLNAEEVAVGIALGEDNSFATNSTAFRAAYVEGVAMVSKEG